MQEDLGVSKLVRKDACESHGVGAYRQVGSLKTRGEIMELAGPYWCKELEL